MSVLEDQVLVKDYVFYNFRHPSRASSKSAVLCNVFRIDKKDLTDSDRTGIMNIIKEIGSWENYIGIKKAEKYDIENEDVNRIEDNFRENMLILDDFEKDRKIIGEPIHIMSIRFSPEESYRRTKGNSRVSDIDVDYIRNGFINVIKWFILKKTVSSLKFEARAF